jgi:hypothetical protein
MTLGRDRLELVPNNASEVAESCCDAKLACGYTSRWINLGVAYFFVVLNFQA